MKHIIITTVCVLLFQIFDANAGHLAKGAFICESKELLSEMISASVKYADAKEKGNESKASDEIAILSSLIINGQCSITDKKYRASLIDAGFTPEQDGICNPVLIFVSSHNFTIAKS